MHGDKAHVNHKDNDEASSWLFNWTHFVKRHVHGDEAHEPLRSKLTIDGEFISFWAVCTATNLVWKAHGQWWSKLVIGFNIWTRHFLVHLYALLRNNCEASSSLIVIRAVGRKSAWSSSTFYEASSSLIVNSFCLSHVHAKLMNYYEASSPLIVNAFIRAICTATELMKHM